MYYVVKYTGPFGFIKPWTAVRDSETYSQQFLTPSIIEGIEKKLFPEMLPKPGIIEKIARHKLSYASMSVQQEVTQAKGWKVSKKSAMRERSVLNRGVMINPVLHLAFWNEEDAAVAAKQHISYAEMKMFCCRMHLSPWKKTLSMKFLDLNCALICQKNHFLLDIIVLMKTSQCMER
jgi:hypothetical protein